MYTRGTPHKYKGKSLAKGNPLYKETPYIGNSCKGKCLRKDNPAKSLVNGNPLYKEIPHTGNHLHKGNPS